MLKCVPIYLNAPLLEHFDLFLTHKYWIASDYLKYSTQDKVYGAFLSFLELDIIHISIIHIYYILEYYH